VRVPFILLHLPPFQIAPPSSPPIVHPTPLTARVFIYLDSLLKLPVKITEFKILGTLRFMLAPIIDEGPFVKAMTFSFLKPPDLNYGNLQAVFIPLSRIPGLANFIHDAISGSLVMFTWPSTMPIPFGDMTAAELAAIARRSPSGLLRIKVVRATNLRGVDLDGKSTPFVRATLGTQKHACKPPKKNTINPVWNYAAEFIVHDNDTDTLDIFVKDKDKVGSDTLLGRVQFDMSDIQPGRHSVKHALTDPGGKNKARTTNRRPEIELIMEYLPFHIKETPYTADEASDYVDPTWISEIAEAKPRGMLQKFDVFSRKATNGKLFVVVKNLWCIPKNADKPIEIIIKFGDIADDLNEKGLAQDGPPAHQTYAYAPSQMRQQDMAYYPGSPNKSHHLMVAYEETLCLPIDNIHTDKIAIFVKGLPKPQGGVKTEYLRYTASVADKLKDGAKMSILQINDGSTSWDNDPTTEVQLELTMTLLYGQHEDGPPTEPTQSGAAGVGDDATAAVSKEQAKKKAKMVKLKSSATKTTRDTIETVAQQQSGEQDEHYRTLTETLPMNHLMGITAGCYTLVYLAGYFFGWGFFGWVIAIVALGYYGQVLLKHELAVLALQESPNASWVRRVQNIEAEVKAADAAAAKAATEAAMVEAAKVAADMIDDPGGTPAVVAKAAEVEVEVTAEKYCDTRGQARVSQELPRWVKSPAVEKVTWLNEILEAMWPKLTVGISKQVREHVEKAIVDLKESKPFLKQCVLELEEFDMGELPLLVDGVQHYDNQLEGDRIHLDFDLRMATNLAVGVRVGVHRLLSTKLAVRNVAFEGILRVEMSPLVPIMPCFGSVSICFMEVPKIDLDVFIGDFSLLATPFLWDNARKILDDQMRDMLVFPNRITVPVLSDEQLRTRSKPPGAGILRIHLEGATGLRNADLLGKSDPMCCMMLHDEDQEQTLTSSVRQNDLNPVWDEMFEFVVANPNANFEFHIYDVDDDVLTSKVMRKDAGSGFMGKEHLGSASMPFQDFPVDSPIRHIVPLLSSRKKPAGNLTVTATWKPFLNNPNEEEWSAIEAHCSKKRLSASLEVEEDMLLTAAENAADDADEDTHVASVGVLYCSIRNVEDLDPRAAKVRGIVNSQQQTIDLKTPSGVLKSILKLGLLVENPKFDKFVLEVLTEKGDVLGAVTKSVADFSDGKVSNQHYQVEGSRGTVMLQMALRVTNPSSNELMHFHHGMKSIGVLRVKVVKATGLKNVERFSKSDPYVIMSFQDSNETARTAHIPNNLNPEWNAIFEFSLATKADAITFTVKDYEESSLGVKLSKEKVLGFDVQHISALPKDTLIRREYELRSSGSSKSKGSLTVELEWKEFSEEHEVAVLDKTATLAKAQAAYCKQTGWNSAVLFGRLTSLEGLAIKKPRITITAAAGGGPSETVAEFVLPPNKSQGRLAFPFVLMLPSIDSTVTFTVTDGARSRDAAVRGVSSLELGDFLGTHDKPRAFNQLLRWTGPTAPKVHFEAELLVKNLTMDRIGEIGSEDTLDTLDVPKVVISGDDTEEGDAGSSRPASPGGGLTPSGGGHLKFEVVRLRGFDSGAGGTEPHVYVSCRINARRRKPEFGSQKQKTDSVKSANPKFTKNNVFDFTVGDPNDEYIEIHAKSQEGLLGSFRAKGRLAEVHIPVKNVKIGGDYTPGPGALEQEFMFETGKRSGHVVIKVIEWLPAEFTAAGVGSKSSISTAALADDSISISSRSSNASPMKRGGNQGSRKSNLNHSVSVGDADASEKI
jgi:Ca2+-dependent lipid-binding protein